MRTSMPRFVRTSVSTEVDVGMSRCAREHASKVGSSFPTKVYVELVSNYGVCFGVRI